MSLRLEVVREILAVLDTATSAGQQVLMTRVLELLRREAAGMTGALGGGPDMANYLDGLSRESERPAPDAGAFARGAGRVVAALSSS